MYKKAKCFLFALSFLIASNGFAAEEVAANDDVEVTVNENDFDSTGCEAVESEVAENADCNCDSGCEQESEKE